MYSLIYQHVNTWVLLNSNCPVIKESIPLWSKWVFDFHDGNSQLAVPADELGSTLVQMSEDILVHSDEATPVIVVLSLYMESPRDYWPPDCFV